MVLIRYRCGCKEQGGSSSAARRCPMHGDGPVSVVVANHHALVLAFGPTVAPPAVREPLFYPKIQGMKGFNS